MEPVMQENPLGCSVACVAFILKISYQSSLTLFKKGESKAIKTGFYCKEIVEVLKNRGLCYEYKYIKNKVKKKIYKAGSIIFIRRSKKNPTGHYLCRVGNVWMDPWINFPDIERKAGFRRKLPEKPIYVIYAI